MSDRKERSAEPVGRRSPPRVRRDRQKSGGYLAPQYRALYKAVGVPAEDWGLPSGAIIAFAHSLKVPGGKFIGEPLRLREFQLKFIRRVYNQLYDDGLRRVRQAVLSIARRGGKTLLASVLLLAHLVGPMRRRNSVIISAATTRRQAGIVFKFVTAMVRMNPTLSKKLKVIESTKRVVHPGLWSSYEAISAEATGAFGEGIDFCIYDEMAQARNSSLYEALMTSLGSQVEPLMMIISTQAPTDAHLLSELIDYGGKIDAGVIEDESFMCHLYAAPIGCDLLDESAWYAANPTLGDYRDLKEFSATMRQAVQLPARENAARNLYLNQRVSTKSPFLTPSVWQRNAGAVDDTLFEDGRPIFAGLDLSARNDLSALVLGANDDDGNLHLKVRCWTPADTLIERGLRDRAPYTVWHQQNHLIAVPGPTVDYDFVAQEFGELCKTMNIVELAYDRWRIDVMKQSLARFGLLINLRPHGQGFADMGQACDMFEQLAFEGRIRHGDHPVFKWCMSNAVISMDAAGNRKLDKSRAFGRIDIAVAALMATTAARLRIKPIKDISSWIG